MQIMYASGLCQDTRYHVNVSSKSEGERREGEMEEERGEEYGRGESGRNKGETKRGGRDKRGREGGDKKRESVCGSYIGV